MVEVGRHLWKSPGLFPLLKQGHLNPITWGSVQIALEYYQGCRLYNTPGQPAWSSTLWKIFPCVQREPSAFQFGPIAPCPVTGCSETSLTPSSWHPSFQNLHTLLRATLSLHFPRLSSPISASRSLCERCCSPSIILVTFQNSHKDHQGPKGASAAPSWSPLWVPGQQQAFSRRFIPVWKESPTAIPHSFPMEQLWGSGLSNSGTFYPWIKHVPGVCFIWTDTQGKEQG